MMISPQALLLPPSSHARVTHKGPARVRAYTYTHMHVHMHAACNHSSPACVGRRCEIGQPNII